MKSYLPICAVTIKFRHRQVVYGIADLAERLRRTLCSSGFDPHSLQQHLLFWFICALASLNRGHCWIRVAAASYVRV